LWLITFLHNYIDLIYPNHRHHELVYKKSGTTIYYFNNKEISLNKNSILYLPKNVGYSAKIKKSGECIAVGFNTLGNFSIKNKAYMPNNYEVFLDLFLQMDKEWFYKKNVYDLRCKSLLYNILALLIQYIMSSYTPNTKIDKIKDAVTFIEKHYTDNNLDIKSAASIVNISYSYFRRLFSEIYFMPPKKYLNMLRIKRAKDLISSHFYTIGEIAEMTGFSNIYYFSKVFKKETGKSPKEYEKNLGKF
jgi:AraC-like DNA-binding protein